MTADGLQGAAAACNVYVHYKYTHYPMRTNIVIDDKLMAEALKASGLRTKREAVEQGLRLLVRHEQQQAIRKLRGQLQWDDDLDEMRGGR